MKKLFLLIPATLILTISMAQDTKSDMSKKNASLDGKSFKITLTTAGSESINPQSGDKSGMNSGTQSGEMKTQDGTSMEKTILEESLGCLNKIFHSIKNELSDESNNSLFINFNPNYYYSIPNSSDLVVKVPVNE